MQCPNCPHVEEFMVILFLWVFNKLVNWYLVILNDTYSYIDCFRLFMNRFPCNLLKISLKSLPLTLIIKVARAVQQVNCEDYNFYFYLVEVKIPSILLDFVDQFGIP